MQCIPRNRATHVEVGAHIEPELVVDLGELFTIETQDTSFDTAIVSNTFPLTGDLPGQFSLHANPVGGPVYVNGVRPGDTVVVTIEDIEIRDWGWSGYTPHAGPVGQSTRWPELAEPFATRISHVVGSSGTYRDGWAETEIGSRTVRWPLAPFIGTLMLAPERGIETTVASQGPWGGNMDVREMRAGNKVHLNASHEGGLLFAGDVHGSQGDSELTGLADETAATLTLRCDVISGRTFRCLARIETPTSLIQCASRRMVGSADKTIESAYLGLMEWLVEEHGMDPAEAYIHMSANSLVRGHIFQAVNGYLVVGAEFPKANLPGT
jgi:amidase